MHTGSAKEILPSPHNAIFVFHLILYLARRCPLPALACLHCPLLSSFVAIVVYHSHCKLLLFAPAAAVIVANPLFPPFLVSHRCVLLPLSLASHLSSAVPAPLVAAAIAPTVTSCPPLLLTVA